MYRLTAQAIYALRQGKLGHILGAQTVDRLGEQSSREAGRC